MCDMHVTPKFIQTLATIIAEFGEEAAVGALRQLSVLLAPGGMPKDPNPETLLLKIQQGIEALAMSDAPG